MSAPIDPVLEDIPCPIVTPRLLIRPIGVGDGKHMNEAKQESWNELTRWMPWAQGKRPTAKDISDDEVVCRKGAARFLLREDLWMVAVERATGKHVIWTGLHRMNWSTRSFEIGYWCRTKSVGNGYASEAANALTRFALDALRANRVEIKYDANNEKSAIIPERLGFEIESCARNLDRDASGKLTDVFTTTCFDKKVLPPLLVTWGDKAEERCPLLP